jgi:hypothetical protein
MHVSRFIGVAVVPVFNEEARIGEIKIMVIVEEQ